MNSIGVRAALATALKVLLDGLTPLNQIDADLGGREPGQGLTFTSHTDDDEREACAAQLSIVWIGV